ncbi:MAG: leucine--tRNA ligase [Phycisphaerae bacterium]|nr:leucine--tRNA ligase [Phycisphaerae bacterium]
MSRSYSFNEIEQKWQRFWENQNTFGVEADQGKPKYYVLDMFPYPSGAGLHVGHPEGYTATDIMARYKRMKGFNVLHPMGYDSFGLPAQQYAVEHGIHPRITTERNIANIERQIKMFGFSYDWSRRVATTDPQYYRWTQWIFLQMYGSYYDREADAARPIGELKTKLESGEVRIDARGGAGWAELSEEQKRRYLDSRRLAYMAEVPVNWCPALGTVLANEEVTNEGRSERGDHPVYRRNLKQWMLRITAYADRLERDLEGLDWPERIKLMQRNWIGKSTGAEVDFPLESVATEAWFAARKANGFTADPGEGVIRVYTTRPDTLFGATYMVLAPEHPLVAEITTDDRRQEVQRYVSTALHKSELERVAEAKEKTGVFSGAYAINPVNREKVPVWVADYVLMSYGTGAIMAVPAHDTRDLEFAEKFGLPVIQVVEPPEGAEWRGFVDDGVAVNSGAYNGLATPEFKRRITEDLEKAGLGRFGVNYKLRDWIFSRQWYWGEPFPIVHCERCGTVPVPEDQLPVLLPEIEDFTPAASDDPEAPPQPPLSRAAEWASVACPACGESARREVNAMPQWAGSCWYYLRYIDPRNDQAAWSREKETYWMPVDLYVGGAEHAVLHLLYARFWHKVLFDLGYVSTAEPFAKLFNQGMIRSFAYRDQRGIYVGYDKVDSSGETPRHKETGEALTESIEKMSKSLKNVVNPDEVIGEYGADTFRLYEMFMGPLEASKPWNTRDVPGVHRFLHRVWRMVEGSEDQASLVTDGNVEELERSLHKLIRKVGQDVESMKFNTAIAAMMEFVNAAFRSGRIGRGQAERFLLVLAPFAPHIAEELWRTLGHDQSLAYEPWPAFDAKLAAEEQIEVPVQINGKVRSKLTVAPETDEKQIEALALADPKVQQQLEGKRVLKVIVAQKRLVNIVAK